MGKNAVLGVIAALILAAIGYFALRPTYPTTMTFEDATGMAHSFTEYQQQLRPVVVTLVMDADSYSPRAVALLAKLRGEFSEEQLEVLAFDLNAADAKTAETYATAHALTYPVVPVRKTPGLDVDLIKTLGVRYAGDVAVIDLHGRIKKLLVGKDLTADEFETKVRSAVSSVVH
jgi:hypothetical protein